MPPNIVQFAPEIKNVVFQNLNDQDLGNAASVHSSFNGPARRLYPHHLEIRPDNALTIVELLTARSLETWTRLNTLSTTIPHLTICCGMPTSTSAGPSASDQENDEEKESMDTETCQWSVFFDAVYKAFRHHFTSVKELKLIEFQFIGNEERVANMRELLTVMGCTSPYVERLNVSGIYGPHADSFHAILQPGLMRSVQCLDLGQAYSNTSSTQNLVALPLIPSPQLTTLKLRGEQINCSVAWSMLPTIQNSSITTLYISQSINDTKWNAIALQRIIHAVSASLLDLRLAFGIGSTESRIGKFTNFESYCRCNLTYLQDLSLCQVDLSRCRLLQKVTVDIDQRLYGPNITWLDQSRGFNIFDCLKSIRSQSLQLVRINAKVTARTDRPFVYRYSWDRFDDFMCAPGRFPCLTSVKVRIYCSILDLAALTLSPATRCPFCEKSIRFLLPPSLISR